MNIEKLSPSNQLKMILLRASELGVRLHRSNVGLAWAGSRITKHPDGSITIHDPRPFHAGVKGMSDSTGWRSVLITTDMVGLRIAQYAAIEAKQGTGRLSTEQVAFIEAVKSAGGIAGVARTVEDVDRLLGS